MGNLVSWIGADDSSHPVGMAVGLLQTGVGMGLSAAYAPFDLIDPRARVTEMDVWEYYVDGSAHVRNCLTTKVIACI